jgi:SAM-dependent methyltransferase
MDYSEAIEKESAHWGKRLPSRDADRLQAEDQEAAKQLRINRDMPSFAKVAKDRGWHFRRALSLGCGAGRAERQLMEAGLCDSIVGFDVSGEAVKVAQQKADEHGYAIQYEVQDLNRAKLPKGEFDLVFSQNCLHHIVELEHVAEQIALSLRPEGILWVQDFIGETQFQWSDTRIEVVNQLRASLPKELLVDRIKNRPISALARKDPATLGSPFEAIRSAEILPVLEKFFSIDERWEGATVVPFVCPRGTRLSFLEHAAGKSFLDMLFAIDRILLKSGKLTPTSGRYVMRSKFSQA